MQKVKLPRKVAENIETLRKFGYTEYQMVFNLCRVESPHDGFTELHRECTDTIIRALYIGYEVEETPEEKISNLYNRCSEQAETLYGLPVHQYWEGKKTGISDALDILGIKIEGVNA